jgi:hypothetical protein
VWVWTVAVWVYLCLSEALSAVAVAFEVHESSDTECVVYVCNNPGADILPARL